MNNLGFWRQNLEFSKFNGPNLFLENCFFPFYTCQFLKMVMQPRKLSFNLKVTWKKPGILSHPINRNPVNTRHLCSLISAVHCILNSLLHSLIVFFTINVMPYCMMFYALNCSQQACTYWLCQAYSMATLFIGRGHWKAHSCSWSPINAHGGVHTSLCFSTSRKRSRKTYHLCWAIICESCIKKDTHVLNRNGIKHIIRK